MSGAPKETIFSSSSASSAGFDETLVVGAVRSVGRWSLLPNRIGIAIGGPPSLTRFPFARFASEEEVEERKDLPCASV